jgi:cell fate regulator YaaT (PSP1 superfamily)
LPVAAPEYLVSYGTSGGFGRFAAERPMACSRGQRVVVESRRGLELGVVLCEATAEHARLLPGPAGGRLLRPATAADEQARERLAERGRLLFEECCRLAAGLGLPLQVVDVELLLDGRQLVVQHLSPPDCDAAGLIRALADRHGLAARLENLALSAGPAEEESRGGCGKPDCGRVNGSGGCTSCEGGGCSSCGAAKVDLRAYFAHLRDQMEQRRQRTPLL